MRKKLMCPNFFLLVLGLAQGQVLGAYLAVYWDGNYADHWITAGDAATARDGLAGAGYEVLDADQLKAWMDDRIADGAPSVIVFAKDVAPETVVETNTADCTLRQYLDEGGKIVFYGDIPFYNQGNPGGGETNWGSGGSQGILGINAAGAAWDSGNTVQITEAGEEWGLTETWASVRPAVAADVDIILATDDSGAAAAWVKHYVPDETSRGFVRIWDRSNIYSLDDLKRVAEYGLGSGGNPLARRPDPEDGALLEATWATLSWKPGYYAVSHDVYIGDNFDDVDSGAAHTFVGNTPQAMQIVGFVGFPFPDGLVPGMTYYWRVDEVNDANAASPWKGDVWSFWVPSKKAYDPDPADGVGVVLTNAAVSWATGFDGKLAHMYFGKDAAEVEAGTGTTYKGPAVATTYDPGPLEEGTTYHWRVDQFDGVETHKGDVWSLTTVPSVAVTDPSLLGWWTLDEGEGTTVVDWSGHGGHGSFVGEPQWADGYQGMALEFSGNGNYVDCGDDAGAGATGDFTIAAWAKLAAGNAGHYGGIAGKLDNVGGYHGFAIVRHSSNVYRLWVSDGDTAGINGFASSDVLYTDTEWHHVAGVREGRNNILYVDGVRQAASNATDFIASADFFHIGRQYNHLDDRYFNGKIDDVRVYNRALTDAQIADVMLGDTKQAGSPVPGRDALLDIRDISSLSWSPGSAAASHDVYLGQDRDAVAGADNSAAEFQGNQAAATLSVAGLVEFGGGDYYWRVDEVESGGAVHAGTIWKFTVPDYLIVDNFESYTDDTAAGKTIFNTWLDGFGYLEPAPAYPGNGTGSVVGHASGPPFAEQFIVHGGNQSMPLWYDNDGTILEGTQYEMGGLAFHAEAQRTWEDPQDWTSQGVESLGLWLRGDSDNVAEPLYVELHDSAGNSATIVHPDPAVVMLRTWQEWNIVLTDFAGVNLTAIERIYIGIGDKASTQPAGSGVMYVDSIRLYRP